MTVAQGVEAPAQALELVPGALHALGGVVPVDGRISWFADTARGWAPLLCYLLTAEDGSGDVLVDTTMPALREPVLAQLAALHPDARPLTVLLSRNPEFDSIGNGGAILTRFPSQRLVSIFKAEEWLYFLPRSGARPPEERPEAYRPEWIEIQKGQSERVGSGGRELLVLPEGAPLRLLSTFWTYDAATRTLFTSDAFGHNLLEAPGDPWTVDAASDTATYEQVRDHLLAKFDWLGEAHTEPIRAQLAGIFDTYDVERIAPQFGRIIEGRDTVARHRDLVLAALEEVGV